MNELRRKNVSPMLVVLTIIFGVTLGWTGFSLAAGDGYAFFEVCDRNRIYNCPPTKTRQCPFSGDICMPTRSMKGLCVPGFGFCNRSRGRRCPGMCSKSRVECFADAPQDACW